MFLIKAYISNLVRTTRFLNILRPVSSKPNILKEFGSMKTKRPIQDRQDQLRSHLPERGLP